jgi:hypothetical protein
MPPSSGPSTEGSSYFSPDELFDSWSAFLVPQNNDLRSAINTTFNLLPTDDYVYHATASLSLAQVQVAIDHGNKNGLLAWYREENGEQVWSLQDNRWLPCLIRHAQ